MINHYEIALLEEISIEVESLKKELSKSMTKDMVDSLDQLTRIKRIIEILRANPS